MRWSRRTPFQAFWLALLSTGVFAKTPELKGKAITIVAPKKLLFLPFYNQAGDKNFSWLETNIGESLHEIASKKYDYQKVDDTDFTMYFINKGYVLSDLYNFEKIKRIARDLGVDGVIYGTFAPDPESGEIVVTGKILSVIDGEIIASKSVSMPVTPEMFARVEEVSTELGESIKDLFFPSDRGALVRAAVLPGWGHRYKQRKTWGYVWGGLFWSAAGFTTLATAQYLRYSIEYKNYSPDHYAGPGGSTGLKDQQAAAERFNSLATSAQSWGRMTLVGLIGVAVIYAGNMLHAFYIRPDIVENPDFTGLAMGLRLRVEMLPEQTSEIPGLGRMAPPRTQVSFIWRF